MRADRDRVTLADVALLVHDQDEALAFYCGRLGFELAGDAIVAGKRRVAIRAGAARLVLRRAVTDAQRAAVGHQAAGAVFLYLETADFDATYARLVAAGVQFTEPPRREPYGTVAVFVDLYGNRIDLIEPSAT